MVLNWLQYSRVQQQARDSIGQHSGAQVREQGQWNRAVSNSRADLCSNNYIVAVVSTKRNTMQVRCSEPLPEFQVSPKPFGHMNQPLGGFIQECECLRVFQELKCFQVFNNARSDNKCSFHRNASQKVTRKCVRCQDFRNPHLCSEAYCIKNTDACLPTMSPPRDTVTSLAKERCCRNANQVIQNILKSSKSSFRHA